jgi:hypothetical protein
MALPGENTTISPPQKFRLAIGETYEKNGRMLPRKQDYITVRRLSVQSGQKPTYITDGPAQKMACTAAGVTEKPIALPISVIGNPETKDGMPTLPESILWSRMARYSGGKCCCSCQDFDGTGKGVATERIFEEKKSAGEYAKTYYVLAQTRERECDPQACPYATGDHDQVKYKGTPLCKPQVVLSVGLPWYPVVGTVAKFKTTGWHSYRALRDSLLAIALQTGGWLHDLPNLWMVLDWELAGNGQLVPSVRIEYRGHVEQLREATTVTQGRWLKQETQLKQLQAGIVEVLVEEEESNAEQVAHQVEFAPEGYDLKPPIIDAEYEVEAAEESVAAPAEAEPTPAPAASFNLPESMEGKLLDLMNTLEMSSDEQAAAFGKLTSLDQANLLLKDLMLRVKQQRQGGE